MDWLVINIMILLMGVTAVIIPLLLLVHYRKNHNERFYHSDVRRMIDSGEYKVYLDGYRLEDTDGLNIRQYHSEIDKDKHIIRFTTKNSHNYYT